MFNIKLYSGNVIVMLHYYYNLTNVVTHVTIQFVTSALL